MKNQRFYWLIEQPQDERGERRWTVERIAAAIYSNRAHVTEVLNGKPGRGGQTRRKLVRFFKEQFSANWPEVLAALGWNEDGTVVRQGQAVGVAGGTFHGEQSGVQKAECAV